MPILLKNNRIIKHQSGIDYKIINNGIDPRFIITIDTTKGTGSSFTLPTRSGYSYNCTVDWGDGSTSEITAYNDADITHTYASGGVYQIKISGKFGAWYFNNSGDKLKLIAINNWGKIELDDGLNSFYGCTNLSTIQRGYIPVTINCLSFGGFFRDCNKLTVAYRELFKLGVNVTSFSSTWNGCTLLNNIENDIYRFNINAISFQNCHQINYSLTSIPDDLHYYNNKVLNYSYEFYNCRNLVLPTRLFNLSNLSIVTSFANFMSATTTTYSNTGTIQDIWNYATGATSTNAFLNQTSMSNYSSIPNRWKGL